MSIVLDPNKSFVAIELYYIEHQHKYGNTSFDFIRSPQELDEWRKKGYKFADEVRVAQSQVSTPERQPGDPIPKTEKIIHKLTTWWKRVNWKEQNIIFSRSLRQVSQSDGKMVTELDTIKYRELKMKTCLKKWDYQDEQLNPMPLTEEVIDNLDPSVAIELLDAFEKITEASEDQKKE